MVSAERRDSLETWRLVITRDNGAKTLITCDQAEYTLPQVQIPARQRIAENINRVVKPEFGAAQVGCVRVDDFQKTTVPSVFCAGEPTSVGGVDLALIGGQIAGLAAAGRTTEARALFGKRRKARRFAQLLDRTFRLHSELRSLPLPDTLVCRCEDVSYSRLQEHASWRAAKLQTRCGMGPCQGRVCGPAMEFLFGWSPDSVRPPVFPARVETLAAVAGPLNGSTAR